MDDVYENDDLSDDEDIPNAQPLGQEEVLRVELLRVEWLRVEWLRVENWKWQWMFGAGAYGSLESPKALALEWECPSYLPHPPGHM